MSGSTRAITLSLSVRDADTVKRQLEQLGPAGEGALQRLEAAAQRAAGRGGAGGGGGGFGGLGQAVGQAGFQIQDFAVQVQSGTSALTALSQQGSQLLGVFGTGGAIAGAVLTVALLATQLATGGDAAKAFNDALKQTKELYDLLNSAAERRAQGLSDEIARVLNLRDYYASLTAEQLRGVQAAERASLTNLTVQASRGLDTAAGRVRGLFASGQADDFGLAQTPEALRGVEAAYLAIDVSSGRATDQLFRYIGALEAAIAASPRHQGALTAARDAALQQVDAFNRVDEAARAAGRGIDEAAIASARLARQVAAGNVGQELTAQVFSAQQVASAFARGNVAEARRLTREQELDQRARQLAEQAEQASRRAFPAGTPQSEVDAAIAARRDRIAQDAARLAQLERDNRDREEAARNAEREAERAARAGERAGARDARRTQREAERELNDALRDRQSLLRSLETPYDTYLRRLEELSALQARLPENERLSDNQIQRAADRLQRDLDEAERGTQRVDSTARELGLTFTSAFEDAIVKGEDLQKVLKGIEADLARIIIRRAITEPLANAAGPLVSSAGNFFSGLLGSFFGGSSVPAGGGSTSLSFGGPRAAGGPVNPGSWYLVGERGPEPFIPDVPGRILPTESLRGMGGGMMVNQSFNIDARGADAGVDQKIRAGIAIAVEQANNKLLAQINRGGSVAKQVGRRA
jgi:hypothetical protein